ncbi:MAG: hypothetical protein ACRD3J_10700 [Thermoanaerobaculia bacterium]
MDRDRIQELVLQALETELGGVQIYRKALECVINDDLKEEWTKYLEQTEHHVEVVEALCAALEIDPKTKSPGREVVRHIGASLVKAMELALRSDAPKEAAQIVAAECVVEAETKDHLNWELIGQAAQQAKGGVAKALTAAHAEVEDQEDEHLYHTAGWTRELWIDSLGLKAVLPPPEEEKDVKTAIGAARAKAHREEML